MNEVTQSLSLVKSKVERLLKSRDMLMEKSAKLEKRNEELSMEMDSLRREIDSLRETNQVLRMAKAVAGEDQNTKDLKLRINDYIREIDRCLALINR